MKKLIFAALTMSLVAILAGPAQGGADSAKSIKFPCKTVGTAQLDPIVVPDGGPSAHEHLFIGNKGVPMCVHDYDAAIASATGCSNLQDTAGYWVPTLRTASGTLIPAKVTIYYDRMTSQPVTAFPPNLGMVFGSNRGMFVSKHRAFYGWNCDNTEDLKPDYSMVDCTGMTSTGNVVTFRGFSPFCWDGVDPGVRNYGDHVFYPPNYPTNRTCPAGSIVFPRIRVNVNFQVKKVPAGAVFSSDAAAGVSFGASAHTDFWNTWQQSGLEALVAQLNA